ncbi:hypothetical protein BX616_009359, partial [Lobosporangium transversale]
RLMMVLGKRRLAGTAPCSVLGITWGYGAVEDAGRPKPADESIESIGEGALQIASPEVSFLYGEVSLPRTLTSLVRRLSKIKSEQAESKGSIRSQRELEKDTDLYGQVYSLTQAPHKTFSPCMATLRSMIQEPKPYSYSTKVGKGNCRHILARTLA